MSSSRRAARRATAVCGRSARALFLWREDGARDAAYVTLLGEDFSLPVALDAAERWSPAGPAGTPFAPHAALHDLDDDEAWVGFAGDVRVGEGVPERAPSGCDTTAVWNMIAVVRAPCVATVHAVSGRFELARTGDWWSPVVPATPVAPDGSARPTLRERLARLLGRRREVRIPPATVPGLRFTEDCPAQEEASPRNGWVCGGSTYRSAPRSAHLR